MSALLVAEVDGERLTHDEVRTMVGNLIVGGHDTTGSQIGCTFLTLLRHPDQAAALAGASRARCRTRWRRRCGSSRASPASRACRPRRSSSAAKTSPAGSLLILSTAAANREIGVWAEPDTFDLTRFAQPGVPRLMSFGIGTHYCLGAALARMTLEEAVRAVFVDRPQPARRGRSHRRRRGARCSAAARLSLPVTVGADGGAPRRSPHRRDRRGHAPLRRSRRADRQRPRDLGARGARRRRGRVRRPRPRRGRARPRAWSRRPGGTAYGGRRRRHRRSTRARE